LRGHNILPHSDIKIDIRRRKEEISLWRIWPWVVSLAHLSLYWIRVCYIITVLATGFARAWCVWDSTVQVWFNDNSLNTPGSRNYGWSFGPQVEAAPLICHYFC
jgi:hypothetical protein